MTPNLELQSAKFMSAAPEFHEHFGGDWFVPEEKGESEDNTSAVLHLLWSQYDDDWNFVPRGLLEAVEKNSVSQCERIWQEHVHRMDTILKFQEQAVRQWKYARHPGEPEWPPQKFFSRNVSHLVLEHGVFHASQAVTNWALRRNARITPRALALSQQKKIQLV